MTSTKPLATIGRLARMTIRRAVAGVLIAAVAFVVACLVLKGPALREAAERRAAEQIDLENAEYCEMFGMARGTGGFARCARNLDEIRQRQTDRLNADSVL